MWLPYGIYYQITDGPFRCLQAMLVVGLAFSLDSEMAAGLLYVICVPGGGVGYLVATLQTSAASRTMSATVNLMSTYLVIRMISFLRYFKTYKHD